MQHTMSFSGWITKPDGFVKLSCLKLILVHCSFQLTRYVQFTNHHPTVNFRYLVSWNEQWSSVASNHDSYCRSLFSCMYYM